MKIIRKVSKKEFKDFLYNINIDDPNIYKEANNPHMIGGFQITAGVARMMVEKIQPSSFEELNAANAFARPGTMDFIDQYLENRNTKKSPYPPQVSQLLEETNNIILYQEQVMSVFNKVGGFSLEECNYIRGLMKVLSKAEKKPEDLKKWDEVISRFQNEAAKKGITKRDAKKVADDLLKMSSYQFNKAHSTSYTYIAVMTLYLSYYFRKYFYSSVLNYEVDREKYLMDRLRSVKMQGYSILPPNINLSSEKLKPIKGTNEIIFGLQNIKYVGDSVARVIVENQPYTSFVDFVTKTSGNRVTIRAIKALASIGAFDELYPNRKRFLFVLNKFWEDKKSIKIKEKLEYIWEKSEKIADSIPGLKTEYEDLRLYEKEYLGFNFFTTAFTDPFMEKIYELQKKGMVYVSFDEVTSISRKIPVIINKMRIFNDKNGNEMAMVEIEDHVGERITVPIFQSYWRHIKNVVVESKVHLMNVYLNKKQSGDVQVMFGSSGWPEENEIKRMVKRLDNL